MSPNDWHAAAGRRPRFPRRLGERPAPLLRDLRARGRGAPGLPRPPGGARDPLATPMSSRAAGLLLVVEFLADKVPGIDSAWDAVHTFIRIPAGALLAAGVAGDDFTAITGRGPARRDDHGRHPLRQGRRPRGHQHLAGAVLELGRLLHGGRDGAGRDLGCAVLPGGIPRRARGLPRFRRLVHRRLRAIRAATLRAPASVAGPTTETSQS